MGVSYGGERMIGNLPFSLFNGQKERKKKKKREEENITNPKKEQKHRKMTLTKQGKGQKEIKRAPTKSKRKNPENFTPFFSSLPFPLRRL